MLGMCGVDCTACGAFGTECDGCRKLKGAVPWVPFLGAMVCPIYACAENRGFGSCALCGEKPCKLWLVDTRNPNLSDADFERDIAARLENLKAEGG